MSFRGKKRSRGRSGRGGKRMALRGKRQRVVRYGPSRGGTRL